MTCNTNIIQIVIHVHPVESVPIYKIVECRQNWWRHCVSEAERRVAVRQLEQYAVSKTQHAVTIGVSASQQPKCTKKYSAKQLHPLSLELVWGSVLFVQDAINTYKKIQKKKGLCRF